MHNLINNKPWGRQYGENPFSTRGNKKERQRITAAVLFSFRVLFYKGLDELAYKFCRTLITAQNSLVQWRWWLFLVKRVCRHCLYYIQRNLRNSPHPMAYTQETLYLTCCLNLYFFPQESDPFFSLQTSCSWLKLYTWTATEIVLELAHFFPQKIETIWLCASSYKTFKWMLYQVQ